MKLKQNTLKVKQWISKKLSIGTDKVDHFVVGFILGLVGVVNIWLGIVLGVGFGVGKEIYDYYNQDIHTPDVWDTVATILGTMLAIIIIVVI